MTHEFFVNNLRNETSIKILYLLSKQNTNANDSLTPSINRLHNLFCDDVVKSFRMAKLEGNSSAFFRINIIEITDSTYKWRIKIRTLILRRKWNGVFRVPSLYSKRQKHYSVPSGRSSFYISIISTRKLTIRSKTIVLTNHPRYIRTYMNSRGSVLYASFLQMIIYIENWTLGSNRKEKCYTNSICNVFCGVLLLSEGSGSCNEIDNYAVVTNSSTFQIELIRGKSLWKIRNVGRYFEMQNIKKTLFVKVIEKRFFSGHLEICDFNYLIERNELIKHLIDFLDCTKWIVYCKNSVSILQSNRWINICTVGLCCSQWLFSRLYVALQFIK